MDPLEIPCEEAAPRSIWTLWSQTRASAGIETTWSMQFKRNGLRGARISYSPQRVDPIGAA
jgi:hypothetical protein